MITIKAIGGYSEVGKNCTAVEVDDEIFIIDMGLHMENYIRYTQDEDIELLSTQELIKVDAIPDINLLKEKKDRVKAIIPSHAHLDHIGAIPYLADKLLCPIIGTDFSINVLKRILSDEKKKLKNKMISLTTNSSYKITDKVSVEFVNSTHSTPQTVFVVLHTPYGAVVYANDFKIDNSPTLGRRVNIARLQEISKKGVKALIIDSVRAHIPSKTPSEAIAKEMLKEVLMQMSHEGIIIITTFSSHIARLKSIIEFAKQMNKRICFMGRSLHRYVWAAENAGVAKFSDKVEIVKYSIKIQRKLKEIEKDKKRWLIVVTGHQGEPKSVLSKISTGELKFRLTKEDSIIFSCNIIPTAVNKANREKIEESLKKTGARLFIDVHVSGHPMREDVRELISALNPEKIIPSHAGIELKSGLAKVAQEMGYKMQENIVMLEDGDEVVLY